MSESARRQYRKFSAQQKTELVLASLRGQKTIAELCCEHDISETLLRRWREQFLSAGAERLSGKAERTEADELRRQVSRLELALGRETLEVEVRGGTLAGLGVSMRVAGSRELVAQGRPAALVARVAGISRQAIYRRPKRPPKGQRRPLSRVEEVILGVAREHPTDGTRMVAALASRELGAAVNRKRAQRLMREHRLLQRHRPLGRRRRPGFSRVERPDQLWRMDMTSVWVAEHGWCYLNAIIDCCTREITGWSLDVRCRAALTARAFRARLAQLGIVHRRGGYRDPESQAFIESWFGKLKERCVWREEFETLDEAREKIAAYIETYHHRPHSRLAYRTPREVAATWNDHDDH